jgi:arylsulfatase A-like enzyme
MSMLTGLYPSSHHVNGSFDQFCNHADPGALYRTLDRATPTLAERLRSAGWRTYALTAGACVDAWLGFDHGFDSFHVGPYKLDPSVPAEVGEFLGRHAAIPFFLFLHTYEVHEPYLEVERGRKWLAPKDGDAVAQLLLGHSEGEVGSDGEMLARAGLARADVIPAFYDAGIETADALVGHVVERLKELGLFDRTLLVVTADHGQEFADHDPGEIFGRHGLTLYDELIHVPLVMHVPDATVHGGVVDGIVQSVDLVPTILELLGLPPAADVQGTSLAGLAREGGTSPREFAWSESTESGQEWKSLRTRSHKLIAGFELPTLERSGIPGPPAWEHLFDLAADPKEQNDLVESEARLAQRLHDRLLAGFLEITRPIGDATPGQPLDPDVVERLRKLGYLR